MFAICSLVMHRLDYGNISLYGISEGLLDKLQKAQNAAARLVVKCLRSDHNTPHIRDLHLLPVRSRIKYKILVTTYRALHNDAPAYISEMLTPDTKNTEIYQCVSVDCANNTHETRRQTQTQTQMHLFGRKYKTYSLLDLHKHKTI